LNSNRQGQDWPLGTVQQCTAMHSTVQHFTAPPLQRNTDCDSVVQHCTAHVQGYRHCTSAFWIHSPAILLKFSETKKELSVSTLKVHNILSSRLCARPAGPEFPNSRIVEWLLTKKIMVNCCQGPCCSAATMAALPHLCLSSLARGALTITATQPLLPHTHRPPHRVTAPLLTLHSHCCHCCAFSPCYR
jgi:hypothetical protein